MNLWVCYRCSVFDFYFLVVPHNIHILISSRLNGHSNCSNCYPLIVSFAPHSFSFLPCHHLASKEKHFLSVLSPCTLVESRATQQGCLQPRPLHCCCCWQPSFLQTIVGFLSSKRKIIVVRSTYYSVLLQSIPAL